MSNVDWSKAPFDAEFYAHKMFRKCVQSNLFPVVWVVEHSYWDTGLFDRKECEKADDYETRPTISLNSTEWPDEQRLEIIGHNGPTGEHYAVVDLFEAELVKEGYSKDMLHKNTAGQYYQGYLNSLFKWFAKGVQAQCNK